MMVVYYDSTVCNMCQISHLYDQVQLYELMSFSKDCEIVTIFSPVQEEYDIVMAELMRIDFPYPIYLDFNKSFEKANPGLPDDKRFHSFLLDRDGHPVFIGNPTANEQLWVLFREVLANLEANGGVYVEPEER